MHELGGDKAVLRLWTLADAPPEFQQALGVGEQNSESWIAHVPAELLDEPLVDLLTMQPSGSPPLKTVVLSDGSTLFCGSLSSLRPSGEPLPSTSEQEQRNLVKVGIKATYAARSSGI